MVRTSDILTGILLISGAFLLSRKNGGSYSLQNLPITEQIYQKRQATNTEAILDIQDIQDRLQNIRSQTLQQEKFKTESKIDILQTEKSKAGSIISIAQKFIQQMQSELTYSPRLRRKFGKPINEEIVQRGQYAQSQVIPQLTNLISNIDKQILGLQTQYKKLESI